MVLAVAPLAEVLAALALVSVATSAVLPGQSSQQIGRPWPSSTAPTTIWYRSGRWSLLSPRWPRSWPPSPSKEIEVVSKNTGCSPLKRSRRWANNSSSIRSLMQRGANGVLPAR